MQINTHYSCIQIDSQFVQIQLLKSLLNPLFFRDKLMSQISDGLWNIIRSADGMQSEIKETVLSVYDNLSNPKGKDNGESSSRKNSSPVHSKLEIGDATGTLAAGGSLLEEELNEPPGFGPIERQNKTSHINNIGRPNQRKRKPIEENKGDKQLEYLAGPENFDYGAPPGFSSAVEHKHSTDASDEDPDVPPGFG